MTEGAAWLGPPTTRLQFAAQRLKTRTEPRRHAYIEERNMHAHALVVHCMVVTTGRLFTAGADQKLCAWALDAMSQTYRLQEQLHFDAAVMAVFPIGASSDVCAITHDGQLYRLAYSTESHIYHREKAGTLNAQVALFSQTAAKLLILCYDGQYYIVEKSVLQVEQLRCEALPNPRNAVGLLLLDDTVALVLDNASQLFCTILRTGVTEEFVINNGKGAVSIAGAGAHRFLTTGRDHSIVLYELTEGVPMATDSVYTSACPLHAWAFGDYLFVSLRGAMLKVYNLNQMHRSICEYERDAPVTAICPVTDGQWALADITGRVEVISLQ